MLLHVTYNLHVLRYAVYNALVIRTEPFILESMCDIVWLYNYILILSRLHVIK